MRAGVFFGIVALLCLLCVTIHEPLFAQEQRQTRKSRTAGLSATTKTGGASEPLKPSAIIFTDAHVHLNDPEMQLRLMREAGNRRAIVFWGRNSTNELLVQWAQEHPGRFIPFASISPERSSYRKYWDAGDTALLDVLERHLKQGVVRGIGEISVAHFPGRGFPEADYSPLHPVMRGMMDLAREYDVPVNIHCEITRIREFEQLLRAYPKVTVIWAHGGYTPYYIAKRMLADHPNLFYELSARTWQTHPRSPDYTILKDGVQVWPRWLQLIEDYPRRFLIGTDASHHDLERERSKIEAVRSFLLQLSEGTRERVAHKNIESLMGL
jgi:predicted TIM-barrel fold metal-dependent hydrolase